MKKIEMFEPWFFMFFGVFHLHRIWGLLDRKSYADFWIGIMEHKGWFYYLLMGFLAILCIFGIKTFLKTFIIIIGGAGYTFLATAMYYLICLLLLQDWSFGISSF